jgi:hypothetical protein
MNSKFLSTAGVRVKCEGEEKGDTHTPETRCGGADGAGSVAAGRVFPTLGTTSGSGGGGYVGLGRTLHHGKDFRVFSKRIQILVSLKVLGAI